MEAEKDVPDTRGPYALIVIRCIFDAFKAKHAERVARKAMQPGSRRLLQ
jgi:hypothetical protein